MNKTKLHSFRSKLGLLLLAGVLLIAAGCQAIGGLDFNKALVQSLKATSSESKSSIHFQLNLNEEVLETYEDEEAAMYRLFSDIKLNLNDVKVQDSNHVSFTGNVQFGDKYDIGFQIKQSKDKMVVELDGAKAPFVLDIASSELLGTYTTAEISAETEQSIAELGVKLTDLIGGHAIKHLPNPEGLKVSPATESINGTQVSLLHASFEMNGKQLLAWAERYVAELVKDKEGLEKLVHGVVDLLSSDPVLWEALGEVNPFESGELDAPTTEEIANEAAEEIHALLAGLHDEITATLADDELSDAFFPEALKLNADVYVDSKLDIRKSAVKVSLDDPELAKEEESPYTGFTLSMQNEQWNVGGSVKADAPAVTEDTVDAEELFWLENYETLAYFEEESDLYGFLKNELHMSRQSYTAFNDDYYNPPIIVPGYITLVPIRDVGETFGGEIEYDAKTKQVTLYDPATDTTIIVAMDSDVASVNGAEELWPFPATKIDGTTYVPARKLAEALGADIYWEDFYDDVKMLVIEREL